MRILRAGLVLLLTFPLAGCGGATFSDVLALRDAAISAGLDCPAWQRTHSNAGTCSKGVVLVVFEDSVNPKDELQGMVEDLRRSGRDYSYLVGDNWMIQSPDAADLRERLGGSLIQGP